MRVRSRSNWSRTAWFARPEPASSVSRASGSGSSGGRRTIAESRYASSDQKRPDCATSCIPIRIDPSKGAVRNESLRTLSVARSRRNVSVPLTCWVGMRKSYRICARYGYWLPICTAGARPSDTGTGYVLSMSMVVNSSSRSESGGARNGEPIPVGRSSSQPRSQAAAATAAANAAMRDSFIRASFEDFIATLQAPSGRTAAPADSTRSERRASSAPPAARTCSIRGARRRLLRSPGTPRGPEVQGQSSVGRVSPGWR
jgi:hypothetical protein